MLSKNDVVNALIKEIELQKSFFNGDRIETIYFGGGTPSLLQIDECKLILEKIKKTFAVVEDAEITLEANPDDISKEKLMAWKEAGINRLSIGVQSFFEEELRWMNRAHNSNQAANSLALATTYFQNISVDLIYGTPLLTDEFWEQNIHTALSFSIPHLSCYALTVEEKTPLHKQIFLNKTENVDADKQARHFLQLMSILKAKGYEHYEVSNFATTGFRSKHNSSYWRGEKYLGLGPSAHSYNGLARTWNISSNKKYVTAISNGKLDNETETLTEVQKLNEYIMISLRTIEGMDLELIKDKWGIEKVDKMAEKISLLKINHLLVQNNACVQLTNEGMLLADGIAADLFT